MLEYMAILTLNQRLLNLKAEEPLLSKKQIIFSECKQR